MDQKAGKKLGLTGGGPEMVITNLGCTVEQVRENTGWDIRISPQLTTTEILSDEELHIAREELDPSPLFI